MHDCRRAKEMRPEGSPPNGSGYRRSWTCMKKVANEMLPCVADIIPAKAPCAILAHVNALDALSAF